MQQDCAVHSRDVYWLALHHPHCSHERQEQQGTQNRQPADCAPLLRRWYSCIRFFTNSIRFSVSYMPSILLSQKSPKKSFTYIGTKKAKNSHLKIKFFQKNLRAAETAPKSGKSGYIIVLNCGRSVSRCQDQYRQQISNILCCTAIGDQKIINCVKSDCCSQQTAGSGNLQPCSLPHICKTTADNGSTDHMHGSSPNTTEENKRKMSGSVLDQVADVLKCGKGKSYNYSCIFICSLFGSNISR